MAEGDYRKNFGEEQLEKLKAKVEEAVGHKVLDENITRIGLYTRRHSYKAGNIEVGKYVDKILSGCENEEVVAIFKTEAEFYVVCTPHHGVEEGKPYVFRDQDIYKVEEEEADGS